MPENFEAAFPTAAALATANSLAAALARVQGRLTNVGRDREVQVRSEKGAYTFKYATLAAIWSVARKPLADEGLALVQLPSVDLSKKEVTITTRLIYGATGEVLEGILVLPLGNRMDPQGIGAVISYGRRYSASALLGIVSEDEPDLDDNGPPVDRRQPPAARPTPPPAQPGLSEAEAHQRLDAAQTKDELRAVSLAIRAARFDQATTERLLTTHANAQKRLNTEK